MGEHPYELIMLFFLDIVIKRRSRLSYLIIQSFILTVICSSCFLRMLSLCWSHFFTPSYLISVYLLLLISCSRHRLIALHSVLSTQDQAAAFTIPPLGIRKVVFTKLTTEKRSFLWVQL